MLEIERIRPSCASSDLALVMRKLSLEKILDAFPDQGLSLFIPRSLRHQERRSNPPVFLTWMALRTAAIKSSEMARWV